MSFSTSVFAVLPSGLTAIPKVVSWKCDLTQDIQMRGNLVIQGESLIHTGDILQIGGVEYRVTNRTYTLSGTQKNTQLVLRNRAYELNFVTPQVQISWVSVPEYIAVQEHLANIQQPFLTDLRIKPADVFGVGGWRMSEICAEVAAIGGWVCEYTLPDFYVKSLMLDRKTSLLSFLRGALGQFIPRIFVSDGILYISPAVNTTTQAPTIDVLETISQSDTRQEPYTTLRISGGEGVFDWTKWEGAPLNFSTASTERYYYINKIIGMVTTSTQERTRTFYSKISDTHTTTITTAVYSVDIFKSTQVLLFREEWRFLRKEPLSLTTKEEYESALDQMVNYPDYSGDDEESSPPEWPNPDEYYLDQCDRTVNVYEGVGREWTTPLLVATHHAIWKYLWWSPHTVSEEEGNILSGHDKGYKNPPDPSIVPEGDSAPLGFPSGYDLTLTGTPADGFFLDARGVWTTEAYYEQSVYRYQYTEDHDLGILGGLLMTKSYLAMGIVRPVYPNLQSFTGKWYYGDPKATGKGAARFGQRYIPAHNLSFNEQYAVNDIAFPAKEPYRKLASVVENYKQISLRFVQKTVSKVEMAFNPDAHYFDVNSPKVSGGTPASLQPETQYTSSAATEYVPYAQAPQTLIRQRGMQVYTNFVGMPGATRFVEINFPLCVDWTDMLVIAPVILDIHPVANSISTVTVTTPEVINLTLLTLGTNPRINGLPPGIYFGKNTRIVGASVEFTGSGGVQSQLAIQSEYLTA